MYSMNWIGVNFVSYRNPKKFHVQVYTKTFKCTYQLQLYPFDTQVSTLFVCFPYLSFEMPDHGNIK